MIRGQCLSLTPEIKIKYDGNKYKNTCQILDLVSKSCDSAFVEPCIIISIQKMSANYFNFKDVEYFYPYFHNI